jgi:integrase
MARRCGQKGYIEQKGDWWHVRYREDTPEARSYKSQPVCRAVGKGKKTISEARRLGARWLHEHGINTEAHVVKAIGRALTFKTQAEIWLENLQKRKRNPIPESSVPTIRSALDCWLLPHLGTKPLDEVNNAALRELVTKMTDHLSPKTINTYINMAKEVVESLLDQDGEAVHKRKWNNDFIDLPIVNKREQLRPKFLKENVTAIIAASKTPWERMLYTLLPGGGFRVAEALALDITQHISKDRSVIQVRQQVKGSRIVSLLKTDAAYRDVDLCPELAQLLEQYIGNRTGLLFPSKTGKSPMTYSNVRGRSLKPKLEKLKLDTRWAAMHCFRRFRSSVLRKNRCPNDLTKFWLGHQNRDITDDYAEQLREDVEWRQEIAAAIGLGFSVPTGEELGPSVSRKKPEICTNGTSNAPNAPKMAEQEPAEISA